jgi:midasin
MPQQVRVSGRDAIQHKTAFVATLSLLVALRSASPHISERFPVLISGPPSSGKNTIIQKPTAHLWSRSLLHDHSIIDQSEFNQNVVILNLASRTLDAKSLVGSYVSSTEDPGKFVFVKGPLLRAMKEGKWLVCQDIDRASDVRAITLSTLEPESVSLNTNHCVHCRMLFLLSTNLLISSAIGHSTRLEEAMEATGA